MRNKDKRVTEGERERRAGCNLHLSVSVCVRVQQELDGAGFVWELGLRQF